MNLLTDFHIHTVSSGHAYSTVDEIAQWASKHELEVIAITDHAGTMPGAAHNFHFHNLRVVPEELYGVKILTGAEVNIIDYKGDIDLPEDTISELQVVIASLHPPCIAFADQEEVTACLEKVMENPYVGIIGHPGDARYPFDPERVARAAKRTKTLLELNNASLKPISFRPGVRENVIALLEWCKTLEVPIIVNSDAHICYDVGMLEESVQLLKEISFPNHLIMNTRPKDLVEYIESKRMQIG